MIGSVAVATQRKELSQSQTHVGSIIRMTPTKGEVSVGGKIYHFDRKAHLKGWEDRIPKFGNLVVLVTQNGVVREVLPPQK